MAFERVCLNMLSKYWRILATGSAFFIFGIGGIILSFLIFPLLKLRYFNNETKRRHCARKMIHKIFKSFVAYMVFVGICKVDIVNGELLKSARGKILIANHPSLIDVVVLISIIENADCVVKAGLWKNPFIKGVVSSLGYINNEEDPDTFIRDCQNTFKEGNNLILFPEGTRTTPGKNMVFRRGAANIALRAEVDVLPVMLYVSPTALTKELAWYQVPSKRFTFKLEVKPILEVENYLAAETVSNSVRKLTRDLLGYYNKELNVHERPN